MSLSLSLLLFLSFPSLLLRLHTRHFVCSLSLSLSLSLCLSISLDISFSLSFTFFLSPAYYGVATISRLLKIIGLFCKRALKQRQYSAKEIYNFKEPTNHSHPIRRLYTQSLCRIFLGGSLRLDVSFAEYSLFYRAVLQQRPIILIEKIYFAFSLSICLSLYRSLSRSLTLSLFPSLALFLSRVLALSLSLSCTRARTFFQFLSLSVPLPLSSSFPLSLLLFLSSLNILFLICHHIPIESHKKDTFTCIYGNLLQLTATHCNSLQLSATLCNSLQLTATSETIYLMKVMKTATFMINFQSLQGDEDP